MLSEANSNHRNHFWILSLVIIVTYLASTSLLVFGDGPKGEDISGIGGGGGIGAVITQPDVSTVTINAQSSDSSEDMMSGSASGGGGGHNDAAITIPPEMPDEDNSFSNDAFLPPNISEGLGSNSAFSSSEVSMLSSQSQIYTAPYNSASTYHFHSVNNTLGVYYAATIEDIDLSTGVIKHSNVVSTEGIGNVGLGVLDSINGNITVPITGYYKMTSKGTIEGSYHNLAFSYLGFPKGAARQHPDPLGIHRNVS